MTDNNVPDGSTENAFYAIKAYDRVTVNVESVTAGIFVNSDNATLAITSFTLAEVDGGKIRFIHDGSSNNSIIRLHAIDALDVLSPSQLSVVSISDPNQGPFIYSSGFYLNDSAPVLLDKGMFSLRNTDSDVDSTELQFRVDNLIGIYFHRVTAPGVSITEFTLSEVESGGIEMISRDNTFPSFDIFVRLTSAGDYSPAHTAFINMISTLDGTPTIALSPITIDEGQVVTLSETDFMISDIDTPASEVLITITDLVGAKLLNQGRDITVFNISDLRAGYIRLEHDGGDEPAFKVSVSDGETMTTPRAVSFIFDANQEDAPEIVDVPTLIISQDSETTIALSHLGNISDPDSSNAAINVHVSNVSGGQFENTTSTGTPISSFTLAEVESSTIVFVASGSIAPSFSIVVSNAATSINTAIPAVIAFDMASNDAPHVTAASFAINEGEVFAINAANIGVIDPEGANAEVNISVTASNGQFENTATPDAAITTFTLQQVIDGNIIFVPTGVDAPVITVQASDTENTVIAAVNASIDFTQKAKIIFGDGSGDGTLFDSHGGSAISSDNDTLMGSSRNDVIFGDGSGGDGAIKRWQSSIYSEGGAAGSGDDSITAGAGNDIIFGDGFAGGGTGNYKGGYGGGGGGAGSEYGSDTNWSEGGIGASGGSKGKTADSEQTTLGIERHSYNYQGNSRSGGAGAGIRGDVTTSKDGNATQIIEDLELTLYEKILNDVLQSANSDDRIFSQSQGSGSDSIDAGTGNDYVFAGGGDDSIRGGQGNDTLWGGAGADTFIYAAGERALIPLKTLISQKVIKLI